jgi:hypothetical protein
MVKMLGRMLGGAVLLMFVLGALAMAPPKPAPGEQPFPGTLRNARYVYVTSYDGDQFSPKLLPEDREAIAAVQNAIQKWGKLVLVYRPQDADIVLVVQSHPSEDVLAVYEASAWPQGEYLWRAMGRDGLQANETPLVTKFERGFDGLGRRGN